MWTPATVRVGMLLSAICGPLDRRFLGAEAVLSTADMGLRLEGAATAIGRWTTRSTVGKKASHWKRVCLHM